MLQRMSFLLRSVGRTILLIGSCCSFFRWLYFLTVDGHYLWVQSQILPVCLEVSDLWSSVVIKVFGFVGKSAWVDVVQLFGTVLSFWGWQLMMQGVLFYQRSLLFLKTLSAFPYSVRYEQWCLQFSSSRLIIGVLVLHGWWLLY